MTTHPTDDAPAASERVVEKAFVEVFRQFTALSPPQRVEVVKMLHGCYCRNCGYPAPPDETDYCCAFSDRVSQ
jgi:hypothetical protein